MTRSDLVAALALAGSTLVVSSVAWYATHPATGHLGSDAKPFVFATKPPIMEKR